MVCGRLSKDPNPPVLSSSAIAGLPQLGEQQEVVTLWDAASLEEGASRTQLSAAMGHGADFFHNKPSMFVKETVLL